MTTKGSSKPTYSIPVSNGLFAHRNGIGAAVRLFPCEHLPHFAGLA